MIWESIAAIGSILTVVVIAVSAAFALRHVNQLRRATQLDGTMRIFAQFTDPEFIAARNYVLSELPAKMEDPDYRNEIRNLKSIDPSRHPEYRVLLFLQIVGSLVKKHLIDGPGVYEFAQYSIVKSWGVLEPVARLQREGTNNPYIWEGARYLYENACKWLEEDARKRHLLSPATGEPFRVEDLR